jgi:hypothetical protein
MHRRLTTALIAAGLLTLGVPAAASAAVGTVFAPNPVADLQNEFLTDMKDADYAALQAAYHDVTLPDLDGSGYLVGRWANVRTSTGKLAFSATGSFRYHRDDDRFEQVMAYYWVTQAQRYIQSLGFGTGVFPPVNMESQDVRIDQYGVDNSYSTDKQDFLRFGKGGVDDAEDAEVILHEYGHAMQDAQQHPFGFGYSPESAAIGEGFADYWAVTVSAHYAPTPDEPCVADWDSVSYTDGPVHCLRRVDEDLHYPDDLTADPHEGGEIWSRALWDIRGSLGAPKADTIILDGQFDVGGSPTMPELARSTVAAAQKLYGNGAASAVTKAFQGRGIL